jgi:transposase
MSGKLHCDFTLLEVKMSKVVLGIDVSKKKLDLALLKNGEFFCKTVNNNQEGFEKILHFLTVQKVEKPEIYLESTGSYSKAVSNFFFDLEFSVKLVNPAKIHYFAKSKLQKNKTDKADSKTIAEYGSLFDEPNYEKMSEQIEELQGLYRCLNSLKDQSVQCKNHLENEESLPKSVADIWHSMLENVENQIEETEKLIKKIIKSDEKLKKDFDNLQTIPGIGETTAVAILAEVENINKFANARQLAAFVGVVPHEKTSGTSIHAKPKITKGGNSVLRKALHFPAIAAIRHSEIFGEIAQSLVDRGKRKMQAITAVARRLLHVIFGVLKSGKEFDESLMRSHIHKSLEA